MTHRKPTKTSTAHVLHWTALLLTIVMGGFSAWLLRVPTLAQFSNTYPTLPPPPPPSSDSTATFTQSSSQPMTTIYSAPTSAAPMAGDSSSLPPPPPEPMPGSTWISSSAPMPTISSAPSTLAPPSSSLPPMMPPLMPSSMGIIPSPSSLDASDGTTTPTHSPLATALCWSNLSDPQTNTWILTENPRACYGNQQQVYEYIGSMTPAQRALTLKDAPTSVQEFVTNFVSPAATPLQEQRETAQLEKWYIGPRDPTTQRTALAAQLSTAEQRLSTLTAISPEMQARIDHARSTIASLQAAASTMDTVSVRAAAATVRTALLDIENAAGTQRKTRTSIDEIHRRMAIMARMLDIDIPALLRSADITPTYEMGEAVITVQTLLAQAQESPCWTSNNPCRQDREILDAIGDYMDDVRTITANNSWIVQRIEERYTVLLDAQ